MHQTKRLKPPRLPWSHGIYVRECNFLSDSPTVAPTLRSNWPGVKVDRAWTLKLPCVIIHTVTLIIFHVYDWVQHYERLCVEKVCSVTPVVQFMALRLARWKEMSEEEAVMAGFLLPPLKSEQAKTFLPLDVVRPNIVGPRSVEAHRALKVFCHP